MIRFSLLLTLAVLFTDTSLHTQTPTAGSGSFTVSPLVPAEGGSLRVTIRGRFPFSNGTMAASSVSVSPELITVDLDPGYADGTTAPADGVATGWDFTIDPGLLTADVYDIWVRQNGETWMLEWFRVEPPRVAPVALPSPTPTVTPVHPLGINVATLKDWTTVFTFVDLFKTSRKWIMHRPSDETWDTGETASADTLGWLTDLPADREAGTLLMSAMGTSYPGGRYEVTYDGQGVLDFEWDARVIDRAPSRVTLWVTPQSGIHVIIRETDPTDYIRNIRVVLPEFADSDATFHPTYTDFLSQFSILRFLDWSATNEPEKNTLEAGTREARITTDHASQGSIRSVAWEYMIDIANEAGADPWFGIPMTATDAYVESLAVMVRDRLDTDRTVYVELANEVFNTQFPQHAVAAQRGSELGLADATVAEPLRFLVPDHVGLANALRYQARRSVEMFSIIERVLGRERLYRVLGGWMVNDPVFAESVATAILDWENAFEHADGFAVAPYFGFGLATQEFVPSVDARTVDAVLDSVETEMHFLLDIGRNLKTLTDACGIELIT